MMPEELVQWNKVKGLEKAGLDKLLEQRRNFKGFIEAYTEHLNTVNNKILGALAKADVKTVGVGETRVTLVPGGKPTEKLNKKKLWSRLLELGVKEKVVVKAYADATKIGEPRQPYIRVTEPGEEEEENGD